jgi:zinc transport system ATP-binding protein
VDVRDLSFGYGDRPIFSKIGFSIYKGDFVAIIGANGSGKSTLFRLMLGELVPTAGYVRLFGGKAQASPKKQAVAYLPQNGFSANKDFPATVEEIVMANLYLRIGFLRFPKKEHRERVREVLDQVGMTEYAKRPIGDLSGGQRQRAMLASVLAGGPELLLLDEPTSSVDLQAVQSLFELLSRLNVDQGVTLAMITHDIFNAVEYASRILCLERGSLVELDKSEVYEELSHRHTHPASEDHMPEEAC